MILKLHFQYLTLFSISIMKSVFSFLLLLLKVFLLYKSVEWIYYRINYPGMHSIEEIDWILVLLIIDTWLVSHTKIEINGFLNKNED